MKYFFLFLLLVPTASAMAVTPTKIDFGLINDKATDNLKIYNNIEYGAEYHACQNINYCETTPESAYLEPGESETFQLIILPTDKGNKTIQIHVDEIPEGANIINSISIPATFTSNISRAKNTNNPTTTPIQGKAIAKIRPFWGKTLFFAIPLITIIILMIMKRKAISNHGKKLIDKLT